MEINALWYNTLRLLQDWLRDEQGPQSAGVIAEHAERVARERQETEENGHPEYEVRIDLPSHADAKDLVERLEAEGLRSVHRWKYVLLGAADEDGAEELAERVRSEVPPGSTVAVEGTWLEAYAERSRSPFWFLGGLAE